jgi:hypothetical protein
MQYKSARPCFNISSSKIFSICAVVLFATSVAPRFAGALINILPVSKKTVGAQINNNSGGVYYYPAYVQSQTTGLNPKPAPLPSSGVLDPLFNYLDLGQDPSPFSDPSTQDSIIYFQLQSTNTFTAPVYLVATMAQNSNGGTPTSELVPIISTNNGSGAPFGCNGNCSAGTGGPNNPAGNTFFYLVPYNQGETITIGVSPTAFCESMQAVAGGVGTQNNICLTSPYFNGSVTPAAVSLPLPFNFSIYLQTDINTATVTTLPTPTAQDTLAVSIELENLNPTPSTPSPTPVETCELTQDGVYTPVEGGFSLSQPASTFFQVVGDPAGTVPGLNQLIAIAVPVADTLATTASTYLTNQSVPNNVVSPFLFASINPVVGFLPSQSTTNRSEYTLGFIAEDAAGYVFDDGSGSSKGSCTFPFPFDTSIVQGFLQQSKCFIATAAFRDLNSAPLVLLRSFRDQFLEHFSLGRSFVHWYYAWSPDAAEWLIDHPVFRFPVLLALIPLQVFAWFILHPVVMAIFALAGFSLIFVGVFTRRATE